MKILLALIYLAAPAWAAEPGELSDIYKMRKEIQKTAQIIGRQGVNQDGKRCWLNTFLDRSQGKPLLGLTFQREDGSTIYLFYPHQEFRMRKSRIEGGGVLTEFFKFGKLFLVLENIPKVRETAHIEASGGHFQDCGRFFR